MKNSFSGFHPLVNMVYFLIVILGCAFLLHPVCLGISLAAAVSYCCVLQGWKKTLKTVVCFALPVMILSVLINPLFNHYGVTTLFYLQDGNPVTLESMLFGLVMALMLCAVILWFQCYSRVMTSDKFICLFGRLIPALSLIISMILRFLPQFIRRSRVIEQGQRGIGRDGSGSFRKKFRYGLQRFSILITWSLENAIQTGDSMKSRGYGLKGRTAYSIFRFTARDGLLLLLTTVPAGLFFAACITGQVYASFNPRIRISGWPLEATGLLLYLFYAFVCFLPVLLELRQAMVWQRQKKRIHRAGRLDFRLWETENL